jgi:hypothetical protein
LRFAMKTMQSARSQIAVRNAVSMSSCNNALVRDDKAHAENPIGAD